jgi:DNA-binding transcriptional LysR family regulator
MDLRHLRYFVAVAEELNFRRAAERLHIAQPPLSAQIKALEEELETRLFERSTRSVHLTSAGEVLLGHARSLLAAAAMAEQHVKNADQGLVGTLRIAFLAPTATARFAAILRRYRLKFPGIQLNMRELTSPDQIKLLRADEIDVGLMRPPVVFPELESRFFDESSMILALPIGHRLAKARKVRWEDFDQQSLVLIHPNLQHAYYDSFFAECEKVGAKPVVEQYANDVQSKMWLISAGLGIAPTTRTIAETKRPGLTFRELPSPLPKVKTVLAWKRSNHSPALRHFLECFSEKV